MNKKAKRRLIVVGGIVVIAMLVIVAVAGSGGSASSLSIDEVADGSYEGKKVQVSGAVAADSLATDGSAALFEIEPEPATDGTPVADGTRLPVRYEGALPPTFGTGVVATSTGTMVDGRLEATEMVTKCPSKYESAEGSLTVKGLIEQSATMVGEDTKVCGYVTGEVQDATADVRFEIESQGVRMPVVYTGALPEEFVEGTAVVVTGRLTDAGTFEATEQPAIDTAIQQ